MRTQAYGFAFLMAAVLVASLSCPVQAGPSTPADDLLPAWLLAEWELRTEGGGHWVADNSANKSADEPYDAYGMEWTWGLGKKTLKGRLYAAQNGKDVGTLFEYRLAWHPGEKKVLLTQYGSDGTFAFGAVMPIGEKRTEALQRFYAPDGSTFQVGHRVEINGDEMRIQSFTVSDGGVWTARRSYLWKRVSQPPPKS